jgi:hypothetical protein
MDVSGQLHAAATLLPGERVPTIPWTEGWVGLRAGLDMVVKRKIPAPARMWTLVI